MEKIPHQLEKWINERSAELYEGVEVKETVQGFQVEYRIVWQDGEVAAVLLDKIEHPFVHKAYQCFEGIIDEIVKSALYLFVQKQVADLCKLINFCQAQYGWKFEG